MATLTKQLQKIVYLYMEAKLPWPATTHAIASWAISNKLWQPQSSTIIDQCANQLAHAMREEHILDPQGRSIRAKHVAKMNKNGEQQALWEDIRTASRQHMEIALQQRRQQIVGDCRQLKMDMDSYNENNNPGFPIQMVFDFSDDLEEMQMASNF
jgi:hypothetical protein